MTLYSHTYLIVMNCSRNFVYIIYISLTNKLTNTQTYKTYRKVFVLKNNVLSHVTGPSLGSDGRLHAGIVVMFFTLMSLCSKLYAITRQQITGRIWVYHSCLNFLFHNEFFHNFNVYLTSE